MTPLHIAILLDDRYPDSSGVTRSVQSQADELARLGHNVTIITPNEVSVDSDNVTVVAVPSYRLPRLPKHTRILRSGLSVAKKIVQARTFDIVHSQTDAGAIALASRIAQLHNIPHVHTFHTNMAGAQNETPLVNFLGSVAYRMGAYNVYRISGKRRKIDAGNGAVLQGESKLARLDWRSQAIMANVADAITAPSHFMLHYICAATPTLNIPMATIPTGYSRELSTLAKTINRSRNDKNIRFVSVGRLDREKRTDVTIDAFRQANVPNSELIIIGDGSNLEQLRAQASDMSNVTFLSHIANREKMFQELRNADVFILASYHFDTQAIVILEALLAKLPVLYCDERLDAGLTPENSILTASPSSEDIAAAMVEISNDELRASLSGGLKQEAKRLSPENMSAAYVRLYHEAIKRHDNPSES